jgi:AGCS family alanine or glycine:cation symporter
MGLIFTLEGLLWNGPLLILLMGSHLYFTLKLRGIQHLTFRGIRLSFSGRESSGGISAFGALTTSLAAAIGTGNIIGVATAVALGGPGAVFWCWLTGLLGMATRYAESVLCLRHRKQLPTGEWVGGPMYLMAGRLGLPWLGRLYAVLGVLVALGTGALIQANAAGVALGQWVPPGITGAALALGAGAILLGGAKRIAKVSAKLVPVMSAFYLLGCLGVLVVHRAWILPALGAILRGAFTTRAAGGGFVGSTLLTAARYGTARGLFTNEAGVGTGPMAAAAGPCKHPAQEALISMTGVFWDTVVICAMTGLMLVTAMLGQPQSFQGAGAGAMCRIAFSCLPGGEGILTGALTVFAFGTIVGWSYYGSCCWGFLGKDRRLYLGLYLLAVFLGAFFRLETLWSLGGILAGLMAAVNLPSLFLLRQEAAETLREL